MEWSKLEGKKILVIGPWETPIHVCRVVGCDPDIGICMAELGDVDPWFIVNGPESPVNRRKSQKEKRLIRLELEYIFRQIQSGVFSRYLDSQYIKKLYGEDPYSFNPLASCPFTM